ncbi:MAG: endonuclease domain-containing protein [Patescibacteria group bacterium]|nr:endonuclease domain-containing protein [Patescibacteria group bacterium]MDD4611278.1 endonuclease domain-containing protein [Patescibacteria group bacterium]
MGKIFNKTDQKNIRRFLRKQEIGAEKLLWRKLRNRNFGYKFRRQYGIGGYIVDFYCPEVKLAIEIDGATHSSDKELKNDKEKEEYIKSIGVALKRYSNCEVYKNQDLVVGDIIEYCDQLKTLSRGVLVPPHF